nr:hypothetical protein [uncultured Desulfobulbus sp.]
MRREGPSTITVEEAVSEMVNMDYIPAGFTLLDMLAAFREEAEVEHHNGQIDRLPEEQIKVMEIRIHACQERYALAEHLLESLQNEVEHRDGSMIVLADESFGKQRLTFESVSDWAADRYGIGISRPKPSIQANRTPEENADLKEVTTQKPIWEDVTIKIWEDHKIGYSIKGGSFKRSHFRNIGLMGSVKNVANKNGIILIGLSEGKKFPSGGRSEAKDKTAVSKLRQALVKLTNLSGDPFIRYNEYDGWKPRFTLIDDRNNANEREEGKNKPEEFDETKSSHSVTGNHNAE